MVKGTPTSSKTLGGETPAKAAGEVELAGPDIGDNEAALAKGEKVRAKNAKAEAKRQDSGAQHDAGEGPGDDDSGTMPDTGRHS